MREMTKAKEEEADNMVPEGQDLLGQLFNEKKHISYAKREKNDKQMAAILQKLQSG